MCDQEGRRCHFLLALRQRQASWLLSLPHLPQRCADVPLLICQGKKKNLQKNPIKKPQGKTPTRRREDPGATSSPAGADRRGCRYCLLNAVANRHGARGRVDERPYSPNLATRQNQRKSSNPPPSLPAQPAEEFYAKHMGSSGPTPACITQLAYAVYLRNVRLGLGFPYRLERVKGLTPCVADFEE